MPQSTSCHNLNADKKISGAGRQLWFLCNYLNNCLPMTNLDQDLIIDNFKPINLIELWQKIDPSGSPSRVLSDLFWAGLDWTKIGNELGEINILDIGCGSGNYGVKLSEWANNRINSYTGIDLAVSANWQILKNKFSNFNFQQISGPDLRDFIPAKTNLIISQSAIEHIENDLEYFQAIQKYIQENNLAVIQIHLFPSAIGRRIYPLHGIRQYTPRAVSKITRLFEGSRKHLFNLGGEQCTRVHFKYIIEQGDRRNQVPEEYQNDLREAISTDLKTSSAAHFYALVIQNNFKQNILNND